MNKNLTYSSFFTVTVVSVILICGCSYKREDSFGKLFSKYDLAAAYHGAYFSIDRSPLYAELDSGKVMLFDGEAYSKVLLSDVEYDRPVILVADKATRWGELSEFINTLRSYGLKNFNIPVIMPDDLSYGGQWIPLKYTQRPIVQRIVISGSEDALQVSLYNGDVLEYQLNKKDVSESGLYAYLIRKMKRPISDIRTNDRVVVSVSNEVKLGEFVYVYDYILMASLSSNFDIYVE